MNVQLLAHTPEPEKLITTAAKLCYSKTNACGIYEKLTEENVDKFIKMLADLGHESPLEHASSHSLLMAYLVPCWHRSLVTVLLRSVYRVRGM